MADLGDSGAGRLAIICSQGGNAGAGPPLMLANAAASAGWTVGVLFTFLGVRHLLKTPSTPTPGPGSERATGTHGAVNSPAMTGATINSPRPPGARAIPGLGVSITDLSSALPPRFAHLAAAPLDDGSETLSETLATDLRDSAIAAGAQLFACHASLQWIGSHNDELIALSPPADAAAFLAFAKDAEMTLCY